MLSLILRRTIRATGVVCLLLVAGSSIDISGQPSPNRTPRVAYNALSVLKVPRTPVLHPTGYGAIARGNLLRIGGVLSQADALVDRIGEDINIRVELESRDTYPGYILVSLADTTTPHRYLIDYADLLAMTLFVDSGGTSLYTLWDSDGDGLPPNFGHNAGFLDHRLEGSVALEFHGTRHADALYFLDTCQGCVEPADGMLTEVVERINAGTSGGRYTDIDSNDIERLADTYLNTDVDLSFQSPHGGWTSLRQWQQSTA